ncbi:MAG: signal peptidase I [Clostridia bacterium]|nr:signal peptidase I [Clostridia bacterium]
MKNREITMKTKLKPIELISLAVVFIAALFLGFLLNSEVFTIAEVSNVSMEDTLIEGEKIYINKLAYVNDIPDRGDIVVFLRGETINGFFGRFKITMEDLVLRFSPDTRSNRLIKRVVGLPGDIIEIKNEKVYLNYIELPESYVKGITKPYRASGKITVPEGKIFVMGDNRTLSNDSRDFGFVDIGSLEGKASFRYSPLRKFTKFRHTYYE